MTTFAQVIRNEFFGFHIKEEAEAIVQEGIAMFGVKEDIPWTDIAMHNYEFFSLPPLPGRSV